MLVYLHKLLKAATSAEYWLLSMIPWNRLNKDEMVPKVNRVNIMGRVHRLLVLRAEEPCDQINANDFGGDFGNQEKTAAHVESWNRVPLDKGNGADNLSDERQTSKATITTIQCNDVSRGTMGETSSFWALVSIALPRSVRVRLFRLFLLIPCWERKRLIPTRSTGPRERQKLEL
jgi:hypothetical protein